MSRINIAPGIHIVNNSARKLYVRGRTMQTPEGPVKAWVVLENPYASQTVSGHEVGFPGMGLLASLAGPALNLITKHAPAVMKGIGGAVKGLMGSGAGKLIKSAAGFIPGGQALLSAATSGDVSKMLMALPGIPGGSMIANLLKQGKISPAAAQQMIAQKAGVPTALTMVAPGVSKPRAVRHIPHGGKVPPGYVKVLPVAPSTEGSGFID
jgi:hypothetical protein